MSRHPRAAEGGSGDPYCYLRHLKMDPRPTLRFAEDDGKMNHFALLNLSPSFNLDLQSLEAAYFTVQRASHPDRFAARPPAERQQALQRSADINHAYNTLKNPLARAQYLLHLQGIAVGTEHDSIKPSPALLMETMEWRERIAEADAEELDKLDSLLNTMHSQSVETISKTYTSADWPAMAQETLRLGYIIKAQDALHQRRKIL